MTIITSSLIILVMCIFMDARETVPIRFNFNIDNLKPSILEDALMTAPELLRKYGYPAETHYVQTDDGYILGVHRIPKSPKVDRSHSAVMIMHGALSSSGDWITSGPGRGLAYYLSDLGYDVWLANARGNRYSRNHTSLRISDKRFWDFSWHEIGYYDIPAIIDYILRKTDQRRVHYIGHSQGTTTFFVMASERKEYNIKIRTATMLSPIVFMLNQRAPLLKEAAKHSETLAKYYKRFIHKNQIMPYEEYIVRFRLESSTNEFLCRTATNMIGNFVGPNPQQINLTNWPVIMGHVPAGQSVKQVEHYAQIVISKKFQKYDYGPVGNQKLYKMSKPPTYKLKDVTSPVILYHSLNDFVSEPVDVELLQRMLPNVKENYAVKMKEFSHADYIWAIDAVPVLYKPMAERMKKYDSGT